ncbi:hypothetical protein SAY86_001904 [Trapa natans]|uniref:Flavoprotein pyridine nucleotide cytochrome reductase-like FAD-binding domain-containing protein n=1 Tax=Trapa natans TaxID=22666 RepID=A0AAN7LPQ5_TRANT|nr:hypothetical protein SAY86_001904 [Trapa natans]
MLWCSHCGRSCSSYVTDTSVSCGECGKILVDLTHRKKTSKRTNKEEILASSLAIENCSEDRNGFCAVSHRVEMSLAVALIAVGVGTAYYFYVHQKPKGCLDPENFKEFKLVKRTELSHNVAKFTFALPTPNSVLGLPIGQRMSCRFGTKANVCVGKFWMT